MKVFRTVCASALEQSKQGVGKTVNVAVAVQRGDQDAKPWLARNTLSLQNCLNLHALETGVKVLSGKPR